jgi:HEAT repeat protein
MDGPFYALNASMPWTQRAWQEDEKLGPTFTKRMEEFDVLENQIASLPSDEQERWANFLSEMIETETSPELRRRSVECMARIPGEIADEGLTKASEDQVEKVRIAACNAWRSRDNQTAEKMLVQIAVSDQSSSVRIAALEALGTTAGGSAKEAMEVALEDDDPAIQFQAIKALKNITGEDFGGDIEAWQKYLASSSGLPDQPVLADRSWFVWPTVTR